MLVQHYVEYYARTFPDKPCITQDGTSTSYGEVNDLANRLANGLLGLGVRKGQRVAILGENSMEHLLLFLAAGKIGAVTVSLNYRLAPAELCYLVGDADVQALLVLDDGLQQTLAGMRKEELRIAGNHARMLGTDGWKAAWGWLRGRFGRG